MEEQNLGDRRLPEIRMTLLCFEEGRLTAIQDRVDRLTDLQLKRCLEHQRVLGREVAFELIW